MVNFREAMDRLELSAPDVAEALGVKPGTVRQMRLEEGTEGYRTPPENWRAVLAALARKRGKDLAKVAEQLDRDV